MRTEQEKAWAGEHGNEYNSRSPGDEEANYVFLRRIFGPHEVESVLELGAGTGANIRALARQFPCAHFTAVEINRDAAGRIFENSPKQITVVNGSLLNYVPEQTFDLVLTKGVLIHINPEQLPKAYEVIHRAAGRYILLAEYYNPTPVSVSYRGREDLLWKRDFAGEMLDKYPDLKLLDYGFVYHRDPQPQDDLTWFLIEKVAA